MLDGINRMRRDLRATQEKEKQEEELRKKAEAEKLMYQINPSFCPEYTLFGPVDGSAGRQYPHPGIYP